MLKRLLQLALISGGLWALWLLWRQRQATQHYQRPYIAPISPAYTPPAASSTASASAAPAPKPEPKAEPAPDPEEDAKVEPKATTDAKPKAESKAESNGKPKAEAKAESNGKPKSSGKSRTKPKAAPKAKAEERVIYAYCNRCRERRQMQDPREEQTENGRRAARGTCPVCNATMYTFLKKE